MSYIFIQSETDWLEETVIVWRIDNIFKKLEMCPLSRKKLIKIKFKSLKNFILLFFYFLFHVFIVFYFLFHFFIDFYFFFIFLLFF